MKSFQFLKIKGKRHSLLYNQLKDVIRGTFVTKLRVIERSLPHYIGEFGEEGFK